VWQVAQVAKFAVPPEFAGRTACVLGGGDAWHTVQDAVAYVMSSTWFRCRPVGGLETVVAGWQLAHVVKFAEPPEPDGATTCVVGGGLPWQDVQVTVNSTVLFWWVEVTTVDEV
jgi:hypothetical protein